MQKFILQIVFLCCSINAAFATSGKIKVVNPTPIIASLGACKADSISIPIVLQNVGLSPLQINQSQAFNTNILALKYGADTVGVSNPLSNFIYDVNAHSIANVSYSYAISGTQLATDLMNKDVFVLPSMSWGISSVYISYASVFTKFCK